LQDQPYPNLKIKQNQHKSQTKPTQNSNPTPRAHTNPTSKAKAYFRRKKKKRGYTCREGGRSHRAARYGGEVPDTETKKVNTGAMEGERRQWRATVEK
jgi:hypothetical protein